METGTAKLGAALVLLAFSALALAGDLPDLANTPGVARPGMTAIKVCSTKWGKDARHVSEAMKREVFAAYGMTNTKPPCPCEIDHLVSRELGGADDVRNLWPQSFGSKWNAHLKDKLENRLNREMCAGRITLKQAQEMLVNDWRVAYRRYYGEP